MLENRKSFWLLRVIHEWSYVYCFQGLVKCGYGNSADMCENCLLCGGDCKLDAKTEKCIPNCK